MAFQLPSEEHDFSDRNEDLDTLLEKGLASPEITEDEFWNSVNQRTDILLAQHKTDRRL